MAKVYIATLQFNNNETGEIVPYKRLCITGSVNGDSHTLELKLSKEQLVLAEMLLTSKEEVSTSTRKASAEEVDNFLSENKHKNDDKLFDEGELDK